MIDEHHIGRLMRLCKLLGSGEGLTLPQIRAKLKTSRRTAFRDLGALQAMGISIARVEHHYRTKLRPIECRKRIFETQIKAIGRILDLSMR